MQAVWHAIRKETCNVVTRADGACLRCVDASRDSGSDGWRACLSAHYSVPLRLGWLIRPTPLYPDP
eukprot:5120194-Pyramimonas_sp.AAC.1